MIAAVYRNRAAELTAIDFRPKFDDDTTNRLSDQVCDVSDGGRARHPSNVKVYREMQRTICKEAIRFGVSPQLLAITLQHEGKGRMGLLRLHPNARRAEEFANGTRDISGKGESVGVGQMHPDQAQQLAQRYDNETIDYDEARRRLVYDDNYAVRMAAAYLRRLQEDHGFNDKEAFIAYAYSSADYSWLRDIGFDETSIGREPGEANRRGHRFNELHAEISSLPGYGDRVATPVVAI